MWRPARYITVTLPAADQAPSPTLTLPLTLALTPALILTLAPTQAFQRQLHADAGLSKAAREGLMVYGMNTKRRSARTSLGGAAALK